MNKKKIVQQIEKTTIDENGELKEKSSVQVFSAEREPDYVKLYFNDIMRLSDLPKSSSALLLAIVKRMSYNNDIGLFAPIKRQICEELGIKDITLKKGIELFVEKSILLRKDRGLYIVNPYYFGRGKWEDIKKIRLEVEYSAQGRMILKTDFELKNEEV